ncbi:MAG: response regulator transcription factor [Verrucomicrobia bacterium]|nr:response regulator transcription factor [Verrucomicrobiota bacterium]
MKAKAKPIQVFLVDDHPVVIQGLSALINGEPDMEVCGCAEGVASAMQFMETTEPDAAIVDLSLKDGDGVALIRTMKVLCPGTRVVAYSMHDESLQAERVLDAGARGYVMKQGPFETVLEAIRDVVGGRIWVSEKISNQMASKASRASETPDDLPVERLNHREHEVFRLLGEEQTVSRIAQTLHMSAQTVESCRIAIQEKLKFNNMAEVYRLAALWVQRKGLDGSHFQKTNGIKRGGGQE